MVFIANFSIIVFPYCLNWLIIPNSFIAYVDGLAVAKIVFVILGEIKIKLNAFS